MHVEPRQQADAGRDVFVPPDIREASMRLAEANPAAAASLVRAMLTIPGGGVPIDIAVPDDPAGARYFSVQPDDEYAPVPIFRKSEEGEHGRWLVVALYPPAAYRVRRSLPDAGLLSSSAATTVTTHRGGR